MVVVDGGEEAYGHEKVHNEVKSARRRGDEEEEGGSAGRVFASRAKGGQKVSHRSG